MPRRSQSLLLVVALGLACALPAQAQWKWKDQDGRTQYSDVPPPSSVKEADILQRPNAARRTAPAAAAQAPAAAAPASGAAAPKVDPELEARRKKTEELEAAKKKEAEQKNAAARKENCTQARNYMKSLEDGMRISRTNSNGEREILDDEARAQETKRTQANINSDCGK